MPKELKRFLRNQSGLIISLVMIGVAVSGTWWGLIPFGKQVLLMYNDMNKLKVEVGVLENKLSVLSSMNEFELAQDGNTLVSAIPKEKDVGSIMSTIESSANSVGLSILSLTINNPGSLATEAAKRQSQEEKDIGAGIISASAVLEGQTIQIRQFIELVHSVRRILRLRAAEIVLRPDGTVRSSMALEAFYSPLPTTLGAIDAKLTPLSSDEESLLVKIEGFPIAQSAISSEPIIFPAKSNPFSP